MLVSSIPISPLKSIEKCWQGLLVALKTKQKRWQLVKEAAMEKWDKGKQSRGDDKGEKRAHPKSTPPSSSLHKRALTAKKDTFAMASIIFDAPTLEGAQFQQFEDTSEASIGFWDQTSTTLSIATSKGTQSQVPDGDSDTLASAQAQMLEATSKEWEGAKI